MAVLKRFDIDLDIKYASTNRKIVLTEGDTGIRFDVTISDQGTPIDLTGCRIMAVFSIAGGAKIQDSGLGDAGGVSITDPENGKIEIALFSSSFAAGFNECDIQIYSGDNLETLITAARFNFNADKSPLANNSENSEDELPFLITLISQAQQAEEDAREALALAQSAIERAEGVVASTGDMTQSTYDPDEDGIVENADHAANADMLGGNAASHFATAAALSKEISDRTEAVSSITTTSIGAIPVGQKGAASGVASLDASGKVSAPQASSEIIAVSGNITIDNNHAGRMLKVESACTITIPNSASIAVGTEIETYLHGAFACNIKGASGVYVAYDSECIAGRTLVVLPYGVCGLKKVSDNTWKATGEFE